MLLSGGVIGAERFVATRVEHSVHRETLLAPQARATADQQHVAITGPLNFLLIGSDARADNPGNGERSDTVIVLHIPASLDRAYLVSIPRDLRVRIPAFAATRFGGAHEKINGAFQYGGGGIGGVQLLSQTLSDLLGIQFNGAVIVDFTGFSKVVDELGGVDMCVDVRTESIHIGFDRDGKFLSPRYGPEAAYRNLASTPKVYEPGCQHFVGWEALDYVRQRKTLPNGDYDRQRHQQQFLRAVLDRAQASGLVRNPVALDRLVGAVGGSLTIDTNDLPLDELMYALRNVGSNSVSGITVPSEPRMIGGISYVVGLTEAELLYRALRDDALDSWVLGNPSWINQV
jgi:LCP family protein required for cell wall assembly